MELQLVSHGKHDNLHAKIKFHGKTFRLVLFFSSGSAYILSSTNKHKNKTISQKEKEHFYNHLCLLLENLDFKFKTPLNKLFKHNFGNTKQLLHYIESK